MRRILMLLATTGLLCGAATSVLAQARPAEGERGPRRGGFGGPPSEEMRGWFRSLPEEQRRKIMEKVGRLPPEERRAAIEKLARKRREKGERPERDRFDGKDGERAGPSHGPRRRRGGEEHDRARPRREAKRPAARKPAAARGEQEDAELLRGYLRRLPEERRRQMTERLKNASPEDRKRFREHAVRSMRQGGPGAQAPHDTRRPAARPGQRGDDALRAYLRNLPEERREQITRRLRGATPAVRAKFRQRVAESMRRGGESRRPGMEGRHHGGEDGGRMAGQRPRGDRRCGRAARGPGHGRSQGMRCGARRRTAREGHQGRRGRGRMAMRRGGPAGGRGEFRGRMGHGGMRGPATPGRFGGRQDRMGFQGPRFRGPQGQRFRGPQGERFRGPQGQRFRGPQGQSFRGPRMQTPVRRGGWHDRGRGNRGPGYDRDWMRRR